MNYLASLLIPLGLLSACSAPAEKKINASEAALKIPGEVIEKEDKRESFDSAHFQIIRRRFPSGMKYLEIYENKQTGLDQWKEYYETGKLKEQGAMINSVHIPVGIWNYYSEKGKADSSIDYDKKYPISYFDAMKIAAKEGFEQPHIEVDLELDNKKTFWRIVKWNVNNNKSTQTANVILIDTKTGKVIKPTYIMERIF